MYLIKRIQPTSDEMPPWTGIAFIEPVDSDVLSAQLRTAYPKCSTLRERKHMAAIDFLTQELRNMKSRKPSSTKTDNKQHTLASPEASTLSSDDGSSDNGSTSSFQAPPRFKEVSKPADGDIPQFASKIKDAQSLDIIPSTANWPQHYVFSAVDGRPLQPKRKRKMTTDEKEEYKRIREQGACAKCRKQKGKCTHILKGIIKPGASDKTVRAFCSTTLDKANLNRQPSVKSMATDANRDSDHANISPPSSTSIQNLREVGHNLRRSSKEVDLGPAPSHWEANSADDMHTDPAGYVDQPPLSSSYIVLSPDHTWPVIPSFGPEYHQYLDQDQAEDPMSFSPPPEPRPEVLDFQAEFPAYIQSQWTESQTYASHTDDPG